MPPPSSELALVFACCRWPLAGQDEQRIREAAARVDDWERFIRIVKRNRILPLVHHALDQAACAPPDAVKQELSQASQIAARQSLAMARESLNLQRAFEAARLPVLMIKGAPLALLAYGQLGLKESFDIDLLTSREAVVRATRLLAGLGYDSSLAKLSDAQLDGYLRYSKEADFHHPAKRIRVDLHAALVDHETLLRGVDVDCPTQEVAVAGDTLRTLATDEMFAYLCAHGAIHCWSRLKWLADLRALIGGKTVSEIERLYRNAVNLGGGRSAAVALVLCHELLGLELRDEFLAKLRQDFAVRALCRNVLICLSYRGGADEHTRHTIPWLRTMTAQFFLAPGIRHALAQAAYFWNSPIDRLLTPLPPRLAFLYPMLRLPLWMGRMGKSLFQAIRRRAFPV